MTRESRRVVVAALILAIPMLSVAFGSSNGEVERVSDTSRRAPEATAGSPPVESTGSDTIPMEDLPYEYVSPEEAGVDELLREGSADATYLVPTFEHVARAEGLVGVRVEKVDVDQYTFTYGGVMVHLCDGTVEEVFAGEFEVGAGVRFSCYATATEQTSHDPINLEAAAIEPLEAPNPADLVVIAPEVDLRDGSRFVGRALYLDQETQTLSLLESALEEPASGADTRVVVDSSMEALDPGDSRKQLMSLAQFVALWEQAHR